MDAGTLGQFPQCLAERTARQPLQEGEGVAAGVAAEAVEEAAVRMHDERSGLLVVERTPADEAAAAHLQGNVLADQAGEVGRSLDVADVETRPLDT